jgi:hypothetical protein
MSAAHHSQRGTIHLQLHSCGRLPSRRKIFQALKNLTLKTQVGEGLAIDASENSLFNELVSEMMTKMTKMTLQHSYLWPAMLSRVHEIGQVKNSARHYDSMQNVLPPPDGRWQSDLGPEELPI